MKDNQAKYPQLRFKGFTDPWEQRKAAEIFKSISDKNHPELSVLSASQKLGMIHRDDIGVDIKYDKKSIAGYKRVEPGQFVIHLRSFQGGFAYANVEGITSPAYTVLDFVDKNENDPLFWRIVLTSTDFIKRLETVTYGIRDGRSISFADFSTLKFNVPTFEEQRTIGKFFKKIDLTITLHQRKLAKLKELKQGYLQKLFPKNGSKFPQLRFAGFADAWKQRKLGEEAQLTMGQSPNSENYTKNPDDYILVQGNADMKNGRVVPRVWTTQITKKAEKSDLILSVRAPVGDIGKTDYDVVLGRGVAAIKGNEFIFQQLGKMKLTGYWTRYSTGSTFESINSNDIKDAKIMVPVEEEQQKIGVFFKQLDDTITLHQRKLEKLQELKKGYLQKMFC
ncbi:restriction endonuclease subunit S [Pediococcus pentosaceus]|uniref:restriction endonuclease subunit S n=1 Tax=Pediococcus pentosaceus TaxID=1255 RepID=UPI0018A18905|nr:restriction endonuclease subunit S [Pediococcus pentosaceus]MBF7140473.1 restriction endonuclease subunit S [Pediococcus pentosaceus]